MAIQPTTARAPGKLILSGEHAVIYGKPALVMACDRHAMVTVEPGDNDTLILHLPNLDSHRSWTREEAAQVRAEIRDHHDQFLAGDLPITKVLGQTGDLLLMCCDEIFGDACPAMKITVDSTIPPGTGQGSSAALLVACAAALLTATGASPVSSEIAGIATRVERFQHGTSSGVDPTVCARGGLLRFQPGRDPQPLMTPDLVTQVLHTGNPDSTTGECVAAVARRCGASSTIWTDFERITNQFQQALLEDDGRALHQAIRDNHHLLVEIGVVPQRIVDFVRQAEAEGASAKICGAGAVDGTAAGSILLYADGPRSQLCRAFDYHAHCCRLEREGVHVIA